MAAAEIQKRSGYQWIGENDTRDLFRILNGPLSAHNLIHCLCPQEFGSHNSAGSKSDQKQSLEHKMFAELKMAHSFILSLAQWGCGTHLILRIFMRVQLFESLTAVPSGKLRYLTLNIVAGIFPRFNECFVSMVILNVSGDENTVVTL